MRERLAQAPRDFDVVVVGGGINGAGVARDAALRGLRVGLVEQHDFGSGSSSRTSKLVHGGVRYLEHGAVRLVWEACHERRRLLRLAPHLVRPLPFVFPVFADSRLGPGRLRAGMWLYDLLATFRNVRRHRMLDRRDSERWREGLSADGLRGAALYWDAAMDDARLVLANVLGARAAGACVLNHVAMTRLAVTGGGVTGVELRDGQDGTRTEWTARCVVLCGGVWTNALLASLPGSPRPVAPTRGTHIVVRPLVERAFTLAAGRDGRVFFVLPWGGGTLIGTTDVVDDGDPDRVAPTDAEIGYLIDETNRAFPAARLGRADVVATFAGLRPLLRAAGSASARSREHAVLEPMPRLVAVVGGKYTTYRAVAESVVDRVAERLGRRARCRTRSLPLPGGDLAWAPEEHWRHGPRFATAARVLAGRATVDEATAARWLATYGTAASAVAAMAAGEPALAAPLCASQPQRAVEVAYAIRHEMALRLDDWFLRRSRMAFAPGNGLDAVETAAAIFAAELGWDRARVEAEIGACRDLLRRTGGRAQTPS
jgi:glycerol-3-phosphate dehydrogenase